MGAIIKRNAWLWTAECTQPKMAVPRKAQIVSRVSVCENEGARNYEHIVGQACHADEAG